MQLTGLSVLLTLGLPVVTLAQELPDWHPRPCCTCLPTGSVQAAPDRQPG